MKLFVAFILLTLTKVESKWDSNYDHREQRFNGLQYSESDQSIKIHNDRTDNDFKREHRDPQIEEHTQKYNKNNWPHKKENQSFKTERYPKLEQSPSSQRENHYHDRLIRRGNEDKDHWEQRQLNQYHQRAMNGIPTSTGGPPDHTELVSMARYVIHNADWASIATISTLPAIEGFPFSNVKSMVDGYITNSTGIPYFYMSPLDFSARDLKRNSRATILATLEETKFCIDKNYDAEDPRCTRVMLSGKMKKVKDNSTEYEFAKSALFERHPSMANFPADHDFFVAKLKIAQIAMVDWFGGAKYVPVRDYLAFNYTQQISQKFKTTHEQLVKIP